MIDAAHSHTAIGFAAALGTGLLIGIERERRKGSGATRMFAGVRTFTIASISGALAAALGIPNIAVALLGAVGLLAAIAHWRDTSQDPGITTEVALLSTVLIGMLSMSRPGWAAAAATALVALLYLKAATQSFATRVLSEQELGDAIVLAALALIFLPLLPDRALSESLVFNPYRAMRLVVVMSLVQSLGYIALRLYGARAGLAAAGLASGFISSTATHAAMAARARDTPQHASAAMSGAALSNVATGVQAALVTLAIAPSALPLFAPYLLAMIAAACVASAIAFRRAQTAGAAPEESRPFSLWRSFIFAGLLTAATVTTFWLQREWGASAAMVASALAAVIDVHVSIASMLTSSLESQAVEGALILPLLICLTVNAGTKAVVSVWIAGRCAYSVSVTGGLALIAAAPWVVWQLR